MIHFTRVDLPSPFLPTKATFSPRLMVKVTWSNGMLAIILAHLIADDRIIAASEARRELEVHLLVVTSSTSMERFSQLLDSALHLYRLGWLVSESLDKVLDIGNFLLLVFVWYASCCSRRSARRTYLIVFHLMVFYPSASNFEVRLVTLLIKARS